MPVPLKRPVPRDAMTLVLSNNNGKTMDDSSLFDASSLVNGNGESSSHFDIPQFDIPESALVADRTIPTNRNARKRTIPEEEKTPTGASSCTPYFVKSHTKKPLMPSFERSNSSEEGSTRLSGIIQKLLLNTGKRPSIHSLVELSQELDVGVRRRDETESAMEIVTQIVPAITLIGLPEVRGNIYILCLCLCLCLCLFVCVM